MNLETLIKQRIRDYGAISIADYMALCLTHPEHGYYMRRDPLGASGDFTTAPEISQIFGEMIGLWLAEQWRLQGKPECALVELGPGRGTLMSDLLRATKHIKGFHEAISIHLVEASPVLKQKQWQTLAKSHPRIEWHADISSLPELPLLVVANEFFDALPIQQFVGDQERMVGIENDTLTFLPSTIHHPPSTLRETCQSATSILSHLCAHITKHGGAALVIDYGYEEGQGDTLQAVKNHAYCDVFAAPGEADLTAHVDFGALKDAAIKAGAEVYGCIAQGAFLGRLGAIERATRLCEGASPSQQETIMEGLKRLVKPDQMGELFKVMCVLPKGRARPEGF